MTRTGAKRRTDAREAIKTTTSVIVMKTIHTGTRRVVVQSRTSSPGISPLAKYGIDSACKAMMVFVIALGRTAYAEAIKNAWIMPLSMIFVSASATILWVGTHSIDVTCLEAASWTVCLSIAMTMRSRRS